MNTFTLNRVPPPRSLPVALVECLGKASTVERKELIERIAKGMPQADQCVFRVLVRRRLNRFLTV